jgi:hypothetical protein
MLRRLAGSEIAQPVRLGSLRLELGPVLIARLAGTAQVGDRVSIRVHDGALEAMPVAGELR